MSCLNSSLQHSQQQYHMKYLAALTTVLLLILPVQQSSISHISHGEGQNLESLYGTKQDHMGSFHESSKDSIDSNQFEGGQSIFRRSDSPSKGKSSRANTFSFSEMNQKSVPQEKKKHTLPRKTQIVSSSSQPSPNLSKHKESKNSPVETEDGKELLKNDENYQRSNQTKPFQPLFAGQEVEAPPQNMIRNAFSEPTDPAESRDSNIFPKPQSPIAKANSKGATITEGNMNQPSSHQLLSGASKTASNQLPPSTFKELTQSKRENIQDQASPSPASSSSIPTDSSTPFSASVQGVNSSDHILPKVSIQKPNPFSPLATTVSPKSNSSSSSISPINQTTTTTTIPKNNSPFQSKSAPNGEVAQSLSDSLLSTKNNPVFGSSMKLKQSFGPAPIFVQVERQKSPRQISAATEMQPQKSVQQLKMSSSSSAAESAQKQKMSSTSAPTPAKSTTSLTLSAAAGQDESTKMLSTSSIMSLSGSAVSNPSTTYTSSPSKAQHEKNVDPLNTSQEVIFARSATSAPEPAHIIAKPTTFSSSAATQTPTNPIHTFRQSDQAISASKKSQSPSQSHTPSTAVVDVPIIPSKSAQLSLGTGSNNSKAKSSQTNTTVASNPHKFNGNSSGFATVISLSNSSSSSPVKKKNLLFWPNVESQNGQSTLVPLLLVTILLLAL